MGDEGDPIETPLAPDSGVEGLVSWPLKGDENERPTMQADVDVLAQEHDLSTQKSPLPNGRNSSPAPRHSFSMVNRRLTLDEQAASGRPTGVPDAPSGPVSARMDLPTVEAPPGPISARTDAPTRAVSAEHSLSADPYLAGDTTDGVPLSADLLAQTGEMTTSDMPSLDLDVHVELDDLEGAATGSERSESVENRPITGQALTALLADIGVHNKSVEATFENDTTKQDALFIRGHLCDLTTQGATDAYHRYLLDGDHITRLEYEIAYAVAQKRQADLVEILVSTTVLDEATVTETKTLFLREGLLTLLEWRGGQYRVCEVDPPEAESEAGLDVVSLLWLSACRRLTPAAALEWLYLHAAASITLQRLPDQTIARMRLPRAASRVLHELPLHEVPLEDWISQCAGQNRHDRHQSTVALFLAHELDWIRLTEG
jgi:hypothetical protein